MNKKDNLILISTLILFVICLFLEFRGTQRVKVEDISFITSSTTYATRATTVTTSKPVTLNSTSYTTTTTSAITSVTEATESIAEMCMDESVNVENEVEDIVYEYVEEVIEVVEDNVSDDTCDNACDSTSLSYVKHFSRGTYYAYGGDRVGGSGRQLIDCSYGNGEVKGSIASSYLYNAYGYNYNGERTKVYLEISGYSDMNGWYYVDDSDAGNSEVIDFFYLYNSNCQFQYQGVVEVDCWI